MQHAPPRNRSRGRSLWWAGALAVMLGLATTAYLVRGERWSSAIERTPMELVRYSERRLEGHPTLQDVFGPALEAVRRSQEREPPANLPTLGKGQQAHSMTAAEYDNTGRPRAVAV